MRLRQFGETSYSFLFFLVLGYSRAEPIWGSPPFLLVSRLTPLRRPLRRGTPLVGFFMQNPVKKGPSQARTPIPQMRGR